MAIAGDQSDNIAVNAGVEGERTCQCGIVGCWLNAMCRSVTKTILAVHVAEPS